MFFEWDTFPFRFMLDTCVHFDFWNKNFFEFFIGSPLWFGVFFIFRKMKNSKKNLFQKSKCTHISSINLKGKVSHTKNIVTSLIYFCSYPYGTPCIFIYLTATTWKARFSWAQLPPTVPTEGNINNLHEHNGLSKPPSSRSWWPRFIDLFHPFVNNRRRWGDWPKVAK